MTPSSTHGSIIWLDSTDSTNSEVRRHIQALDNLSIIAAKSQSEGRGQGDHKWSSRPGENLTFSILLTFGRGEMPASRQQVINSFITPVIQELLQEEGIISWVKQPNDIWVGDRKICGILIENVVMGKDITHTIIGVGLNLNQTDWPLDLPNPVSLRELTQKQYPLGQTLERIALLCKKNWERFRLSSDH